MNIQSPARASTPPAARAAAFLSLALLGACASTPPAPRAEMAVAEAAVARANTTGTSDFAAGQLQIAITKLANARQAMGVEDHERAQRLAEQADVDAQVAELHAQAARSRKAAEESQEAARVLREEISRQRTSTPR